jgi:hypothetical protein
MWEPRPLAILRASTACTGITLPSFKQHNKEELRRRMDKHKKYITEAAYESLGKIKKCNRK